MFSPIAFGGCIVFGINSPNFMHDGFGEVLRYTFDADTPPRVAHAKHVKLGFRKGSSYPDSTKFFLRDKVGFFKHVYDSFKAHINVALIKPRLLFRDDHEGVPEKRHDERGARDPRAPEFVVTTTPPRESEHVQRESTHGDSK